MAKVSKSARIPKLGTAARKILTNNITSFPIYQESLEKGRRFFTEEQLEELQQECTEGLTWEEIDRIISQQGLVLTQSNFRKYLQDGLLPRATGHKSTSTGSSAVYDADIIRHINLLLFIFNTPSNDFLNLVINLLEDSEISAAEAVETKLDRPLFAAVCVDLYQGNGSVQSAIDETLTKYPEVAKQAQEKFAEIEKLFEGQLRPKISELEKFLQDQPMLLDEIPDEN